MNIFGKFLQKRSAKYSISNEIEKWPSLQGIYNSLTGNVDEWKSLQLSVVYACIRLISNTIAMLPLNLHQQISESKSRLAIEKPLNTVLYRLSNRFITAYAFKQAMMAQILMFGNAYAEIVRQNGAEVSELWLMSAQNMSIKIENNEKVYEYKISDIGSQRYTADQILHIPGLSFDSYKGYSPLQVMKNEIQLGIELQKFGKKYFENNTTLGSVLEHPGRLGEKARLHLKEDVENNFKGADNALRMMILEEGMRYSKISIPADDAQFIQSRKFQLEEICRYFGVQLHMIQNLDKASFNNIEQQALEFKTYCLQPWATVWEQELYKSCLNEVEKKQGYYAKFNFNALLRSDYKTRMEGYRTAVQMGLYSLNEVRKLEDENPIDTEGGDTHWVNSAMIPIDSALQNNDIGGDEVDVGQSGSEDNQG